MRKALTAFAVVFICSAQVAMAADDGNTQPKNNKASNNSHGTATDLIATTNGTGNVKGIACALNDDNSGDFPEVVVKFYVNSGAAQTVTLSSAYEQTYGDPGDARGYTGWVPFNVRFTSSIRVTIQKGSSSGTQIDCQVSWALD